MTSQETTNFIDCVSFEDCTVSLYGHIYWCLGLTWNGAVYCIQVYEDNPVTHEFVRELITYKSPSKDDCMKHFIEDKYWDGKSFYEVATDMEWIDL